MQVIEEHKHLNKSDLHCYRFVYKESTQLLLFIFINKIYLLMLEIFLVFIAFNGLSLENFTISQF